MRPRSHDTGVLFSPDDDDYGDDEDDDDVYDSNYDNKHDSCDYDNSN